MITSHQNQAVEADSAAESLRTQLKASTSEAETLATELHESAEAVAARDELLEEAEEAAVASKEQFSRVQAEFEKEARRAGEAEALAASSGGTACTLPGGDHVIPCLPPCFPPDLIGLLLARYSCVFFSLYEKLIPTSTNQGGFFFEKHSARNTSH